MLDAVSRRARLSTNSVATSAAVVAVAMFGLGFFAAYDPGSGSEPSAAAPTSAPPSTAAPSTSAAPTSEATTSSPTTAPTTTVAPTTLAPTTTLGVPTTTVTLAPTTIRPTTTVAPEPGHLVISYPHTVDGQMTMVEGGTAALTLLNDGGEPLSFRIDSAGAIVVGATGTASGALFPNETLSVPVVAQRGVDGPGPHGTIAIFTNVGLVTNIDVTVT
jgi:hypothetical protein